MSRTLAGMGIAALIFAACGAGFFFSFVSCGAENVTDPDYLRVCEPLRAREDAFLFGGVIGPALAVVGLVVAGVRPVKSAIVGSAAVLLWAIYVAALFITWWT